MPIKSKKNQRKANGQRPLAAARCSAAIVRELKAVQKEMGRAQQENRHQLYGAQQALTWILCESTMKPSKAFAEVECC
ncbi:MAG: hypothetical protein KGL39_45055 [Patescibacteria group bacterium]|nr:hypothetical protein [Patescibacteria group bacterium]